MLLKKICYKINSYNQAIRIVSECKNKKIIPILFIEYFLIKGLGVEWLTELEDMLKMKYNSRYFQIYVDVKKNYGLFINLIELKVSYIKVNANKETLKRLKTIANLNKVLINPNFSILDNTTSQKIKI